MPPSTSMSDSSQVNPSSDVTRPTTAPRASSAWPTPAGPRCASSASTPVNFTKAAVTCRCSASPASSRREERSATGTNGSRSTAEPGSSAVSTTGGAAASGSRSSASRAAPPRSPASHSGPTAAAVAGLTRTSPASASSSSLIVAVAAGARDHELLVTRLDEEEMTGPRVDAGGHPEPHLADRAHRPARALDEPLHLRGRAAGSLGVRVAGEENQQSVAAKLEDVASSAVRDPDQAFENTADRQHQLLGARSTFRLEPLGEGRESGEIDRDQRPVELAPWLGRRACRPVAHEPRQIRLQGSVPLLVHSRAERTPSRRGSKGKAVFAIRAERD